MKRMANSQVEETVGKLDPTIWHYYLSRIV